MSAEALEKLKAADHRSALQRRIAGEDTGAPAKPTLSPEGRGVKEKRIVAALSPAPNSPVGTPALQRERRS